MDAYDKGYSDYYNGSSDNPYPGNTVNFNLWCEGWAAASEDDIHYDSYDNDIYGDNDYYDDIYHSDTWY